jgi:hypothetical protein
MLPDTKPWSLKYPYLNKLFFLSAAAIGWSCLSVYLLLAPATSFSKKGMLGWLLTVLGIADWQQQLPIDKLIHLIIFFGLVFLWHRALVALPLSKKQKSLWIFLNVAVWCMLGIAIEFLQEAMRSGRQFDYGDMLANGLGCGLGWWVAKKLTPVETGVATKTNCL